MFLFYYSFTGKAKVVITIDVVENECTAAISCFAVLDHITMAWVVNGCGAKGVIRDVVGGECMIDLSWSVQKTISWKNLIRIFYDYIMFVS